MSGRRYGAALGGIIALGLLGRLIHYHLPVGDDDQKWIVAAAEFLEGQPRTFDAATYARVLWIWTVAAWGWCWGLTLESAAVLAFGFSAATMALVAAAARAAFGPYPALVAAAVYATHPAAVIYDAQVLPDTMAITLLAGSMLGFIRFLRGGDARPLVAAALLVGLSYSVKSYFVLAAVPMAAVVVWRTGGSPHRLRHLLLLGAGVLAALMLHPILSWAAGMPPGHIASGVATDAYASVLSARPPSAYAGWRAVADTVRDRFLPAGRLFFGYGAAAGLVLLWTSLFLAIRARRDAPIYAYLLALAAVFLAFLSLTPIRFEPLMFVETLPRYISVLPPVLAVAAGPALCALIVPLRDRRLRGALAVMGGVVLGYNLWVPNDLLDRGHLLEMAGLKRALIEGRRLGLADYVVPAEFEFLVPESFHRLGPRLTFTDFADEALPDHLDPARRPSVGVFVPRRALRYLAEPVRAGALTPDVEYGRAAALMHALRARGTTRVEVTVPYDSFRVWLARAGIQTKGQLVGWVVMRAER